MLVSIGAANVSRTFLNPTRVDSEQPTGSDEPKPMPPEIDRWNWGAFVLNWSMGVSATTLSSRC